MAKYNGSVELISGLKQANNQDFPLVDASAVQVNDNGDRLDKVLNEKLNKSEIGNYSSASVSTTTPVSDNTQIWINPEDEENFSVPEIKDDTVNATDTWSSRKIDQELSSLKSNIDSNTANIKNNKISVDTSLKISGNAADAKVTGDAINSLKEDLINNIYPLNWTDRMWIDKNGKFNAHPTSKATDYIKIPEWFDLITIISSNIELYCAWYDSNKKFISHPNIVVGENNILKPYNAAYIALTCNESHSLVMKKFDSSQIKDFTNIKKKDGIRPISNTAQEVYNPNPSYEGYKMPAGSLGNFAALYDVSEYAGETVELYGTEMGYILQFSDSPKPSTYIGYKKNADKKSIYKVEIDSNAKYLTVNLFGDAITLKMKTSESYATKGELEKSIPSASKKIWCAIGDSITQGSGASSYSNNYYWKLRSKLINAEAIQGSYNFGSGGSSSESICAYCGMKGLYITDAISIPASDAVQIKLNKSVKDAANNVDYCNPCYLSGVKGNLAYSNGAYTFKRSEEGIEISVASGTALITNAGKKCLSAEVLTIFVGTNDKVDDNVHSIDTSVNNTSQLSKLSKNGKYIVITPYVNSVSDDYRNKMFDTFGQRCIDMYKYFSEQAVYDAITKGLLSTGEQSDWKTLLLTDGVHPNNIGHQLICDKIFERMQILGYF